MSRLRTLFAVIGVTTAAVGLAFVADPSLARTVAVPDLLLSVVGGLAILEGVRSANRRRGVELEQAEPPDVEERLERPSPGDDFDDRVRDLAARRQSRWVGGDYDRLRRRLREAAIDGLRNRGFSTEAARARIERGAWTEDPIAGAFLSDDVTVPLRAELRVLFARRSRYLVYASRTADAVAALREVDEG